IRAGGAGGTELAIPTKSGKRSKKEKKKDEDKGLELEQISPFNRGISIGVKFAGLTAVVVAFFMILLGYLTFSITQQEVNDQITQGGVAAVSALEKGVERVWWVKPDKLLEEHHPTAGVTDENELKKIRADQTHLWEVLKKSASEELNDRL